MRNSPTLNLKTEPHTPHTSTTTLQSILLTDGCLRLFCRASSRLKLRTASCSLCLWWVSLVSKSGCGSPSCTGTPAKDSLSARFSNELANVTTARSRGSCSRGAPSPPSPPPPIPTTIGSSSHLDSCSYTSSSSEQNSENQVKCCRRSVDS